jgi:hypothetical protein
MTSLSVFDLLALHDVAADLRYAAAGDPVEPR